MEIKFVSFDEVFLDASWNWLQDEELRSMIAAVPVTKEKQEDWYQNLYSKTDYFIWGVAAGDAPIGVCGLKHIVNGCGEYWGYIGEKSFWGKGIGKEMLCFVEAFAKSVGLNEVALQVLATNERALMLYKKNRYIIKDIQEEFILMKKELTHD